MAVEDFTTYTEVDPNSRITVTSARSSWVGLAKNEDAYVYSDKGAGHFSGDYEHLLDVYLDAGDTYCGVFPWGLANLVDDFQGIDAAGGDEHSLYMFIAFGDAPYLRLYELIAGTLYYDSYGISLDTPYYLKIKRDEAVGTYGTLYCYIYSDSARTNLLDTLSVALHEKEDFRYIYAAQSYNIPSSSAQTGYTENLDLQEAAVGQPYSSRVQGVQGMRTWGGF